MKLRELLVQRIKEIKDHSPGDFDKRDGRWSRLKVGDVHISDVDFSRISNDQLVYIFEHIVRRYYTQR
jgi:hypothetical protein